MAVSGGLGGHGTEWSVAAMDPMASACLGPVGNSTHWSIPGLWSHLKQRLELVEIPGYGGPVQVRVSGDGHLDVGLKARLRLRADTAGPGDISGLMHTKASAAPAAGSCGRPWQYGPASTGGGGAVAVVLAVQVLGWRWRQSWRRRWRYRSRRGPDAGGVQAPAMLRAAVVLAESMPVATALWMPL